jgi:hypothetical protein
MTITEGVLLVLSLAVFICLPLAETGIGQALFSQQVNGSLTSNGSTLVGRTWKGPQWFRRDEIFGLFARRDDDAGAGLGLTIAKTFVEAHGQRIWVETAPGGGAVSGLGSRVHKSLSAAQIFPGNPGKERTTARTGTIARTRIAAGPE